MQATGEMLTNMVQQDDEMIIVWIYSLLQLKIILTIIESLFCPWIKIQFELHFLNIIDQNSDIMIFYFFFDDWDRELSILMCFLEEVSQLEQLMDQEIVKKSLREIRRSLRNNMLGK